MKLPGGYYRRRARQRVGWRNGYEPKRVQSEAGPLELAIPQLRGTDERFQPIVPQRLGPRRGDLETLVCGMYVGGQSMQDMGALFSEVGRHPLAENDPRASDHLGCIQLCCRHSEPVDTPSDYRSCQMPNARPHPRHTGRSCRHSA